MGRPRKDQEPAASPIDEEYEVEKILDDRRKSKKLEYLVSWLGYGPEENTWLPEAELDNCGELVTTYWNSKGDSRSTHKKQKRKSTASTNLPSKRPRSSVAQHSSEEDEIEEEDPHSERTRELLANYTSAANNWEDMVKDLVTVERDEDGLLKFFVVWKDQHRMWIASDLLYQRCPQKVIKFFEAHLKFKKS